MALNVGGNQRGQGNSTLADGSVNDATASPVTSGRVPVDYPVQIATGLQRVVAAIKAVAAGGDVSQYRVVAVGDEVIVAEEFDGTTVGASVQIARANDQRKSFYNGKEVQLVIGGETKNLLYTYVSATERTVTDTDTGQITQQEIRPRYVGGDIIFASTPTNGTGVSAVTLIDLNVDGRKFTDLFVGTQQMIVKSEAFDYWVCRNFISGTEGDTDVLVAKPWKLRRTPFDKTIIGGAFNGIEYTYAFDGATPTPAVQRSGLILSSGCTLTEILIPRMIFSTDLISAMSQDSTNVLGPDGNELTLIDANNDSRYWTRFGS